MLRKKKNVLSIVLIFCCFPGEVFPSGSSLPFLAPQSKGVVVEEINGVKYLRLNGRIQSAIDTKNPDKIIYPYAQMVSAAVFSYLKLPGRPSEIKNMRLLMIGLGGGTIARHLNRYFPQLNQTAVELDPEIAAQAKKQFLIDDKSITVVVAEGRSFLEKSPRPAGYDIIILDAFDGDYIPYSLMTWEFLTLVKKNLKPEGLVVANTWFGSRYQDRESATYLKAFGQVYEMHYVPFGADINNKSGNRILIYSALYNSLESLKKNFIDAASALQVKEYRIDILSRGLEVLTVADKNGILFDKAP